MTDSGQLRSSISLPGYHVNFFTFAEHVSFKHSTGSPWPVICSGREGNINKQTYKTQKFFPTRIVDQAVRIAIALLTGMRLCSGAPRPVRDLALAPRLSVATESTGTFLTPSQMSETAGHGQIETGLFFSFKPLSISLLVCVGTPFEFFFTLDHGFFSQKRQIQTRNEN